MFKKQEKSITHQDHSTISTNSFKGEDRVEWTILSSINKPDATFCLI